MTIHTLKKEKHEDFLKQERIDPITGDLLQENDKIVICASCKSAFLVDSWEYLNRKHCNQNLTLKEIPKSRLIKLKRSLVENLVEIKTISRFSAAYLASTAPSLLLTLPVMLCAYLTSFTSVINAFNFFHIFSALLTFYFFLTSSYKSKLKIGKYSISFGKEGVEKNHLLYQDITHAEIYKPKMYNILPNKFSNKTRYALKIIDNKQQTRTFLLENNELERIKSETNLLEKFNTFGSLSSPTYLEIKQNIS